MVTASQPSRHTLRNKRKKRRVFAWFRKREKERKKKKKKLVKDLKEKLHITTH